MRDVIVVAMLAIGLVLIAFSASKAEDLWQVRQNMPDGSWAPWVSPKGHIAPEKSLTVCLIDLASARVVDRTAKLDCRKVQK